MAKAEIKAYVFSNMVNANKFKSSLENAGIVFTYSTERDHFIEFKCGDRLDDCEFLFRRFF